MVKIIPKYFQVHLLWCIFPNYLPNTITTLVAQNISLSQGKWKLSNWKTERKGRPTEFAFEVTLMFVKMKENSELNQAFSIMVEVWT